MQVEAPISVRIVKGRNDMKQTKKIGLTGIMGAGKSSVIEILKEMGIRVEDCDKINAMLLGKQGAAYEQMQKIFGKDILDDNANIDSQKLSRLVFDDSQKKQQLEQLLHPLIKQEIIMRCAACDAAFIVVEVPLLFEVHWESFFDEVWVVSCEEKLLFQRLKQYRHIDQTEAKRRLQYQMSQKEKCANADVVFYNNKDKAYLKTQILREVTRLEKEG